MTALSTSDCIHDCDAPAHLKGKGMGHAQCCTFIWHMLIDLLLLVKSCHDSFCWLQLIGSVKMTKKPGWHAMGAINAVKLCIDVQQRINSKMIA